MNKNQSKRLWSAASRRFQRRTFGAALLTFCLAFLTGGSTPTRELPPNSRLWDQTEPAPELDVKPVFRAFSDAAPPITTFPWDDPPDAEAPPADDGPFDGPVADPYLEQPSYEQWDWSFDEGPPAEEEPVNPGDPWTDPIDEGPIDEPVPDPYVEGPIDEPVPDPYVEGPIDEPVPDPYVEGPPAEPEDPWSEADDAWMNEGPPAEPEGPIDEPVPDPYVEGPIDEPVPDPYVEGPIDEPVPDPYVEGPIDEPVPDPYVEGPIDEPVPDPYVEGPPAEPEDPWSEADDAWMNEGPPAEPEGPIDEPVPDPYVEGPIDEPVPDPYVEGPPAEPEDPWSEADDAWMNEGPPAVPEDPWSEADDAWMNEGPPAEPEGEYQSVMPIMDGTLPARVGDLNDDGTFRRWGPVVRLGGMRFDYMARYQPGHLRGSAFWAVSRALATWENLSPQPLFKLSYIGSGGVGPARDGRNVISWRHFTGEGAAWPAVVYLWDNGTEIVEADIVLNAARAFGIGATAEAGQDQVLENMLFDLQSVMTHEIGHVLGLADRDDDAGEGSSMCGSIRMRELRAQTLSDGDRRGLQAILQAPRKAEPPER